MSYTQKCSICCHPKHYGQCAVPDCQCHTFAAPPVERETLEGQREGMPRTEKEYADGLAAAVATERAQERYPANGISQHTPEQIRKAVAERNDPKNLVQQPGQIPATPSTPEAREPEDDPLLAEIQAEIDAQVSDAASVNERLHAPITLELRQLVYLMALPEIQLADLTAKVARVQPIMEKRCVCTCPAMVRAVRRITPLGGIIAHDPSCELSIVRALFPVPTPEDSTR